MKLIKTLTSLVTISLVVASVPFVAVSCSKKPEEPVPQTIQDFISDRTFSLMASPICQKISDPDKYIYGGEIYGTAWIVEDSTPTNKNDYCYYIATNWHVTRGFDLLYNKSPVGYRYIDTFYFFADDSSTSRQDKIIDIYDYTWFDENNYIQPDDTEETEVSDYLFSDSPSKVAGIDFHVCNVNFIMASQTIKNKLNRVNNYRKEHGYINKFVNSDDENIIAKTKYIGGYPAKYSADGTTFGGRWETHSIDKSLFSYSPVDTEDESHPIDDEHFLQDFNYYDCSAQYKTDTDFGTDWMSGGASGSMLVTEDFEICGIYWGGKVDDSQQPTWFKPRVSLLKTSQYDFISRWLEK